MGERNKQQYIERFKQTKAGESDTFYFQMNKKRLFEKQQKNILNYTRKSNFSIKDQAKT